MPIGYPDFYSFSILEQYNVLARQIYELNTIGDGETNTIFSITGKGKMHDGFVYIFYNGVGDSFIVKLTIDGKLAQTLIYTSSLDQIREQQDTGLIRVFSENDDDLAVTLHINWNVIFFESLSLTVTNNTFVDVLTYGELTYFEANPQIIYAPL